MQKKVEDEKEQLHLPILSISHFQMERLNIIELGHEKSFFFEYAKRKA